jgi:hypothetical protein
MNPAAASLLITADRDSVCAGDDCESHERAFLAPLQASVETLIQLATHACPLASISGGEATWIVKAGGYDGTPIAVLAQQWPQPRRLTDDTVQDLFAAHEQRLHFTYWCQASPDAVFDALAAGTALPARHG